jgi:hypothetical protein
MSVEMGGEQGRRGEDGAGDTGVDGGSVSIGGLLLAGGDAAG